MIFVWSKRVNRHRLRLDGKTVGHIRLRDDGRGGWIARAGEGPAALGLGTFPTEAAARTALEDWIRRRGA